MKSIIELAKEAGFEIEPNVLLGEGAYVDGIAITKKLERFAALVRAEYEKPLKLAEEALERLEHIDGVYSWAHVLDAIRETLADHVEQSLTMVAEPANVDAVNTSEKCVDETGNNRHEPVKQEPVAYMFKVKRTLPPSTPLDVFAAIEYHPLPHEDIISKEPLYAAPVRTKDLTDDEIEEIGKSYFDEWSFGFARAVIAADREKNK